MKLEKVDHVGIAVKNLDETLKFYTDVMGINKNNIERSEVPGTIKIATIVLPDCKMEFVEFIDLRSPQAKYADSKADCIHHFAIIVDNIEAALNAIRNQGGTLVTEKPMQMPSGRKNRFCSASEIARFCLSSWRIKWMRKDSKKKPFSPTWNKRRQKIMEMGGPERIASQKKKE